MPRNAFRELNENEYHMLVKFGGIQNLIGDDGHLPSSIDWDQLRVSYEILPGGFTACLIRLWVTEYQTSFIWRGVSRCAQDDVLNRTKGQVYAFKRAIQNSKPVEI